ncbi:unnamed protein product [Eruca vesicaria subsp. sativa]|uniref:Uncharacterized protein n=1 Tax=Eruca vesicaria subsp. sativa TaxID=29727 RepID=A0ABC8IUX8_ERUVS|nr:unnamed protein product [Eruca vesicaria subsp. sativa]
MFFPRLPLTKGSFITVFYTVTDTPIVVSTLDGSTLKLFLEDEDDFAVSAENVFTKLDEEDKGKLPKS